MAKGWSVSGVSVCIPQCSIPNSIYMIVLNVLQPHLAVQCDCSPSPSFPSPLLSFYPPPSVFAMDCLTIDSYWLCTSLFIIPPSSPLLIFSLPSLFDTALCSLH